MTRPLLVKCMANSPKIGRLQGPPPTPYSAGPVTASLVLCSLTTLGSCRACSAFFCNFYDQWMQLFSPLMIANNCHCSQYPCTCWPHHWKWIFKGTRWLQDCHLRSKWCKSWLTSQRWRCPYFWWQGEWLPFISNDRLLSGADPEISKGVAPNRFWLSSMLCRSHDYIKPKAKKIPKRGGSTTPLDPPLIIQI